MNNNINKKMKLRVILDKGEKFILCPNGSKIKMNREVLFSLLKNFNKPSSFKGEDGFWKSFIANMEDVPGKTIAYVDDTYNLVTLSTTLYEDLVEKYISATDYAEMHGKSRALIKRLCSEGRIEGVYKTSSGWFIPELAPYPERKPRESKVKE